MAPLKVQPRVDLPAERVVLYSQAGNVAVWKDDRGKLQAYGDAVGQRFVDDMDLPLGGLLDRIRATSLSPAEPSPETPAPPAPAPPARANGSSANGSARVPFGARTPGEYGAMAAVAGVFRGTEMRSLLELGWAAFFHGGAQEEPWVAWEYESHEVSGLKRLLPPGLKLPLGLDGRPVEPPETYRPDLTLADLGYVVALKPHENGREAQADWLWIQAASKEIPRRPPTPREVKDGRAPPAMRPMMICDYPKEEGYVVWTQRVETQNTISPELREWFFGICERCGAPGLRPRRSPGLAKARSAHKRKQLCECGDWPKVLAVKEPGALALAAAFDYVRTRPWTTLK